MAKNGLKTGLLTLKMRFSDLGVNRKVVSNGLFYLNMKIEQLFAKFKFSSNQILDDATHDKRLQIIS